MKIAGMFYILLSDIGRYYHAKHNILPKYKVIAKGINALENTCVSDIKISDLAKMCNVSYSYFSRIFKQITKHSFSEYLNYIRVCLGGYAAEGIIFGEDRRSSGALSDLSTATQIASKMVRMMGMSDLPFVTTHLYRVDTDGLLIREENQDYINSKIKNIIEGCLKDVIEIINMPHIMNMLKSSSKYLAQHSRMPKHVMNELLATAKSEGEILQDNKTYYRDIVKNL